ncbi:flagellar basal body P-ring protein FlgI [bacterium]|nr:flagellar basal body P-ring protein FlgI [bacterium]
MRWPVIYLVLCSTIAFAGVRIGDVTNYPNSTPVTLTGYGLIIGLAGTGDGSKSTFTPQTFASMLKQFGIEVSPGELKLKNVAAVMVTCEIPAGSRRGARLDALVSSLGDATSLQGGTLLRTVLNDPWGEPVAEVQGPVSIGGFNFETGGNRVSRNHAVAGRIPNGAVLFGDGPQLPAPADSFILVLEQPDLRTAVDVTRAINAAYSSTARTEDPATIVVSVPSEYTNLSERLEFQANIEDIEFDPVGTDKIVINERTGTIVVGTAVTLLPTAIAHGNLTVEISEQPVISQPNAFGQGETVVETQSTITVENAGEGLKEIAGAASAGEVARMLNSLGVTPRDMIAIFQGLKAAGALRAELVII